MTIKRDSANSCTHPNCNDSDIRACGILNVYGSVVPLPAVVWLFG